MRMQRALGGYTLIEVMIFLAVSSLMLVVTIVAIRGQQAHTEFVTTMNDVNSKFQNWIDQVVNGYSGSTASSLGSDYKCTVDPSGSPILNKVAAGTGNALGANPECLFLGKAIQFNDNQGSVDNNHIYAYTILGRRAYSQGGVLVTSDTLKNANPIAAYFSSGPGGTIDLTEDYKIPEGVRVLSVKSTSPITDSTLGGFFSSFSSGSSANGASSLLAVQYPYNRNDGKNSNQVLKCLDGKGQCNSNPPSTQDNLWPMNKWEICFDNLKDDERALLTITSGNGLGAAVQLKTEIGAAACS